MTRRLNDLVSDAFRRHAAELRHFLRSRRGAPDADDLVQEGFVRLLQTGTATVPDNARAWLYRTCANLAADSYDHRLVRDKLHVEDADVEGAEDACADPARVADARQQLHEVWAALLQLPVACRRAFLLNRLDGMSQRDIALHLGIAEKTVERHVLRALDACRHALDDAMEG